MEYKYLLEERVNKNILLNDIVNKQDNCILNIICYHVDKQCKYPFLQFMMEKVPYCNDIVKEQLIFPYIFLKKTDKINIKDLVLEKIKIGLNNLKCESNITEDMYKGIIFGDDYLTPYVLVNVTGIDICGLIFFRQTTNWFVLPSEIINNQRVLNIDVDKSVIKLFTNVREIGHLIDNRTNKFYMIPDVVYTSNKKRESEFKSIFGNTKTKIYDNCGEYYFFYRSFYNVVKNEEYINRYALFTEGKLFFENNEEFSLNDDEIEKLYPEPCIVICYSCNNVGPDILVKNDESFVCLSYHILNKTLLDNYLIESKNNPMIA